MENEENAPKEKKIRKAVYAVQVGDKGFRIVKATNLLDIRVGSMLTKDEAQNLINSGVNVTIGPNK